MKALDDNRIVELYLLRDETAIKQITEKYGSRLRSLAYGIVNDLQTAEECENDTYVSFFGGSNQTVCVWFIGVHPKKAARHPGPRLVKYPGMPSARNS